MSSSSAESYEPSYREEDVDNTLEKHHTRIRRLEKAMLLAAGYGLAEGGNLATQLMGLI